MSIIRLTTTNNSFEANVVKAMLENNGINCFLTNENFSNIMPHYSGIMGSGVQVMIEDVDFEKAQSLLLTLERKEVICPNCNSTNIDFTLGHKKSGKIFVIILSLLAWIPFANIKSSYYCRDCKQEFNIS